MSTTLPEASLNVTQRGAMDKEYNPTKSDAKEDPEQPMDEDSKTSNGGSVPSEATDNKQATSKGKEGEEKMDVDGKVEASAKDEAIPKESTDDDTRLEKKAASSATTPSKETVDLTETPSRKPSLADLIHSSDEKLWNLRFETLKAQYEKHGSWGGNPVLVRWIRAQREQFTLRLSGKPNSMSDDRLAKLKDLEFVLGPVNKDTTQAQYKDQTWHRCYGSLAQYKKKHGHIFVPKGQTLSKWVEQQRREFELMNQGKKNSLTDYRVKMLHKLGFWDVPKVKSKRNSYLEPPPKEPEESQNLAKQKKGPPSAFSANRYDKIAEKKIFRYSFDTLGETDVDFQHHAEVRQYFKSWYGFW